MDNYKFLSPYLKTIKWLLMMTVILMIVESLILMAITGMQQRIIDDVLIPKHYEKTLEIIIIYIVLFCVYSLLFVASPYSMHQSIAKFQQYITDRFMDYMYKIPQEKLQKERTATFVHAISNDIQHVSELAGQQIPRTIQQIVLSIVLIIIVGKASFMIVGICTVVSIIYILLGFYFSKRVKRVTNDVQEMRSRLLVHVEEGVSSTREIIAYNRLQWEEEKYNQHFKNYYDKTIEAERMNNFKIAFSEPFNWGIRLFILAYGGFLVFQESLSIGMFVIIFQFSTQLVQSYQDVFNFIMKISANSASVERIRNIISNEIQGNGRKEIQRPIQSICFNHVSFTYQKGERNILNQLTFELPVGKKIAIVGGSGGGKSTITKLLIRLFEPDSGQILINDIPLNEMKREKWLDCVSIVFQEPYFFPDTIRNNLLLGNTRLTDEEIRKVCEVAQIDQYIMSLPQQYDTEIGDRGITLSGGQRQRLAIARALIRDSDILILDEATSALDQKTERILQYEVDLYRKGKTTIIAAHRLSTIKNADLIIVMEQGEIVESGTHDDLMVNTNSLYRKLVYVQEKKKYL